MNVLLTNDDGIESRGIKVLADRLSKDHNVYVLAPESNRSAVSHHISMMVPTSIKKHSERWYSCSGYPSDCACIGLTSDLFDVKFDVLISGINAGCNLGTDIVYSGTCGAARQGIFDGVPSIALSLDPIDWAKPFKYEALADFAAKNLEALMTLANLKKPRIFVNVNGASLDSYKGVVFGNEICVRNYNDKITIKRTDEGIKSNMEFGTNSEEYSEKCDTTIVHNGYVCVNRIYADPVCADIVDGVTFKL